MSRTAKLFVSYCYFFPLFFIYFLNLFSPTLKMSVFPEFSFPFNNLDNADFNLAIYEMQNGPVRYDADILASLSFNSFLHYIRSNRTVELVELLLVSAHFLYARAVHGMSCPLSYARVTPL